MSVETFYASLLNLAFLVCGSLICSCFALSYVAAVVASRKYSLEALLVAATCIYSKIPLMTESGLNLKLCISPATLPMTCSACSLCLYLLWLVWLLIVSLLAGASFLVIVNQAESPLKFAVESSPRTPSLSDLTFLSPLLYFLSLWRVSIFFWAEQVFFLWQVSLSMEPQSLIVKDRFRSVKLLLDHWPLYCWNSNSWLMNWVFDSRLSSSVVNTD